MENTATRKPASFAVQADALMRKNATLQRRSMQSNMMLLLVPVFICLFMFAMQKVTTYKKQQDQLSCNCQLCTPENLHNKKICPEGCEPLDLQSIFSSSECAEPHPVEWPVLFEIPEMDKRATSVKNTFASFPNNFLDLPDASCKDESTCPVTILLTGMNRTLAKKLGNNLYGSRRFPGPSDSLDPLTISSKYILGTPIETAENYYAETGMSSINGPLYIVQRRCKPDFVFPLSIKKQGFTVTNEVGCVQGLNLWRENSSAINFLDTKESEYLAAYDFLNTNEKVFNVTLWYEDVRGISFKSLKPLRVLRNLNAASNSYLRYFKGANVQVLLEFVKEMPKGQTKKGSHGGFLYPLLFTWTIELLFPVILVSLVYEKQGNLRMIMKMHGLGDRPYWVVNYAYFLFISSAYVLCFILIASIIGLDICTVPDYSVQFVFYFIYVNLQVALAFLASTLFSDVKTASVIGYIYVFASGLLGLILFEFHQVELSGETLQLLELIPGFALFRGIKELDNYASQDEFIGGTHHSWKDVASDKQGFLGTMLIMIAAYPAILLLAYYIDQVGSNGTGVRKHPLWFLPCFHAKRKIYEQRQGYDVLVSMENQDVSQEREKVEKLVRESNKSHIVICNDLQKVYPSRDGNPPKCAVRGLSLALPRGECFGMLGPNGAGKTSFISMMTGLSTPTAGTAFIQGLDIREDMDEVYTRMGLCPQHDLLWDELTGREHLLFYGRLKNLKGDELTEAIQETLRSLNLLDKANKLAGQYSGGMKRRLSVAISLIGDPIVVYMDEPSTGLDPASRKSLWRSVQNAKKDRVIILTTHSMEEAEFLCDRVGIFVDGGLKCIGNPKELKCRYGGQLVLTMTTPPEQEGEVEKMVMNLSPQAKKVYRIPGTQKFHLPKEEVTLASVFREVENAKSRISIQAWGLADTTLEDVFVKVARGPRQSPN